MPSRATARWLFLVALIAVECFVAGGAWAQAAEAAAAAGKAADAFFAQGMVIVTLAGAIVFLFRKLDGQSAAITGMVR